LKNFVITTSKGKVFDFKIYQGIETPLCYTFITNYPQRISLIFDRYFNTVYNGLIDSQKKKIMATGTIMSN